MRIDVFSDVVCPWCFIGKRRLERALACRPDIAAEVHWRAFQLNPGLPPEGMDRRAYLEAKFGGAARARQVHATVIAVGAGEGIAFNFDAIRRTPSTVQAHRLIRLADRQNRQNEVVEALFRAYFLDGRDIGSNRELAEIAAEGGLDPALAESFLAGTAETQDVLAEGAFAARVGINGVPCFILNGRYALSGAQEPEALYPLFDLALHEAAARSA